MGFRPLGVEGPACTLDTQLRPAEGLVEDQGNTGLGVKESDDEDQHESSGLTAAEGTLVCLLSMPAASPSSPPWKL